MAYMIGANMVSDALAVTYTWGDPEIGLDDVTDFPTAPGGVVLLDDDVEWILVKYGTVDAPNDELETLAAPIAVRASVGGIGHTFQIGTVVKLTRTVDYINPIVSDIIGAPAGAIFYEDTDEIGSSASFTFDGTTFKCDKAAVFNESGADVDFRIEGVGEANAFFVQGSDGRVGIGTAAPLMDLDIAGDVLISDASPVFTLGLSTNVTNPIIRGVNDPVAGAHVLRILGRWDVTDVTEIRMSAGVDDIAKDDGVITLRTAPAGALVERMKIESDGTIVINETGVDADFRVEAIGLPNAFGVQGSAGNVGVGTATFQAAAVGCAAIANGTEPGAHTDNQIYLYSKDSVGGGDGSTLGIYCEHAVDAGAWVADAAFHIWFNGVEYRLGLDTV